MISGFRGEDSDESIREQDNGLHLNDSR